MPYDTLQLIGRAMFGAYFIMNAYNHFAHKAMLAGYAKSKGVSNPEMAVQGTGLLLLIGGLSYVTGMHMQYGWMCLAVFLIGVTPQMHAFWKVQDPMAKMTEQVQFTKNMALLGAVLMTAVAM